MGTCYNKDSIKNLEDAITAKADEETINAKIAELEAAILSAESVAKAYADTGDEALNNELTAAIASAKTELVSAIDKKADAEAVNAKIAELEAAIARAESVAKAYADTGDEALKNELTAAIASAKAELSSAISSTSNVKAISAKITELELAESALTSGLDLVNQRTDELEKENKTLRVLVIISCVASGVLFCGFSTFAIWFIIDRRKRRI